VRRKQVRGKLKRCDLPSMRHPQHFLNFAPGRYPGSQVGHTDRVYRLPMNNHSGILIYLHLLTVAGAAQGWKRSHLFPV
jgi:hypothetical protein